MNEISKRVLLNVMWKRRGEREEKSRYHKLVKFCVEEKLFFVCQPRELECLVKKKLFHAQNAKESHKTMDYLLIAVNNAA